mmetsp:Transcript_173/g.340  ORF Transcript_173/g.340 Transcript_173/m.340 type:complete len:119 (-) Transcript_173:156-512(-)
MFLRREVCGAVIGRQGSGIARLREQSGARVSISEQQVEGMRPCHLEGPLESVLEAERLIWEVVLTVPISGASSVAALGGDLGWSGLAVPRVPAETASGAATAPVPVLLLAGRSTASGA